MNAAMATPFGMRTDTSMDEVQRSQLPFSKGKSFDDLESYLAHLKVLGAQDVPFYELIAPDRYRRESGRGSQNRQPEFFSREDLLKKYGFSH